MKSQLFSISPDRGGILVVQRRDIAESRREGDYEKKIVLLLKKSTKKHQPCDWCSLTTKKI